MLANAEGKQQIIKLGLGRLALGDDFKLVALYTTGITVLKQITTGQRTKRHVFAFRVGHAAGHQKTQVLLGRQNFLGRVIGIRADHDFRKQLGDFFGSGLIKDTVNGNDATKSRNRVTGQRLVIGFNQGCPLGNTARIGVLDDGNSRFFIKLGYQFERCIRIIQVIERQFLTLKLGCGGNARTVFTVGIERSLLMRVFTVTQGLFQFGRNIQALREGFTKLASKPA